MFLRNVVVNKKIFLYNSKQALYIYHDDNLEHFY